MRTRKCLLVIGLIAMLVALLGFIRNRENKGLAGPVPALSKTARQSGVSSSDTSSDPVKTKVNRSRAVVPPSPEEIEAALARRLRAVHNARQIGLALFEFENNFGAFPNEETAAAVKQATGTTARLGAATANDCFYQLVAANILPVPDLFTWDDPGQDKDAHGLEKCTFSYLSGMTASGNSSRPLVVGPLVPGTQVFDRKALGGKAVVLRVDNSVSTVAIEEDGTVKLDGMDIFDPAQPFWGGSEPQIKWPEK